MKKLSRDERRLWLRLLVEVVKLIRTLNDTHL